MKLNLKYSFLTRKVFGAVILGEGYIYIKLIADILADNLILKAGDKLTGAECKRMTLSLAAVKSYAVLKAFKVDNNGVAVLCGAVLNRYHSGVSFSHRVYFSLNLFGGNLNSYLFSL